MKPPTRSRRQNRKEIRPGQLAAEMAYANSIFRFNLGDRNGSLDALRKSHEIMPTYAPAILSLGSVEYQLRRPNEGRRFFLSLLDLPADTEDLVMAIDQAGEFLIQSQRHADGLELYRRAAKRFPRVAVFHQGLGCCAGALGFHEEAIAASRKAMKLEPKNQQHVNDLGFSLSRAGRLDEARKVLERAVAMEPDDGLAKGNLQECLAALERKPRPRK